MDEIYNTDEPSFKWKLSDKDIWLYENLLCKQW